MNLDLRHKTNVALEAIREVHSDQHGSISENIDAISEIIEECQMIKSALEDDLKREE